jgi:hypothetical protein
MGGHLACMEGVRKFWLENLKGRDNLGDLGANGVNIEMDLKEKKCDIRI